MQYYSISLQLSKRTKELKLHFQQVRQYLEEGLPLTPDFMATFDQLLTEEINDNPEFQKVLLRASQSSMEMVLQLLHEDNDVLNLPWLRATDNASGKKLLEIPNLHLVKGFQRAADNYHPLGSTSLKILVMVSSPEDSPFVNLLSYEEEETRLIQAFDPLLQTGRVEIHFTEDGSLESLEKSLQKEQYHILHFSGHGSYNEDTGTGYLHLEDPIDLSTQLVSGNDFTHAIIKGGRSIPLVVLSSCQTAKGKTSGTFGGVTNRLLEGSLPAIVSMSMKVLDDYATKFMERFYTLIAQSQPAFVAFTESVRYLKRAGRREQHTNSIISGQWMIPQFYLSQQVTHIVNLQASKSATTHAYHYLKKETVKSIFPNKSRPPGFRFIGRRKERAKILPQLLKKAPILLKGQGGVGKTSMAEWLVKRLMAREQDIKVFCITEEEKSIARLFAELQQYQDQKALFSGTNRFKYLLEQVAKHCTPVFVFDNLESFQSEKGGTFDERHHELVEFIIYLCECKAYYVIITARYPLMGLRNLEIFDLQQVNLIDFWKKSQHLSLKQIRYNLEDRNRSQLSKQAFNFLNIVQQLYLWFGGNYFALELFDAYYRNNPEKRVGSLEALDTFQEKYRDTKVTEQMAKALLFEQLLTLLDKNEAMTLQLLGKFQIPVQKTALQMQMKEVQHLDNSLKKLQDLTLLERREKLKIEEAYYYVNPIIKELTRQSKLPSLTFSIEKAAEYHYQVFSQIDPDLSEVAEAFHFYYQAGSKNKVNQLGYKLTDYSYRNSLFQEAYYYATKTAHLLGKKTLPDTINYLALLYELRGELGTALDWHIKNEESYRLLKDKPGEASALNNLGLVYGRLKQYRKAIQNFRRTARLGKSINDKSRESIGLNNLAMTYNTLGRYKHALKALKRSLKINEAIQEKNSEDRLCEGTILLNWGESLFGLEQYERSLGYFQESLKIFKALGEIYYVAKALNWIGLGYFARGEYQRAQHYFERSVKIFQEIDAKDDENSVLANIKLTKQYIQEE